MLAAIATTVLKSSISAVVHGPASPSSPTASYHRSALSRSADPCVGRLTDTFQQRRTGKWKLKSTWAAAGCTGISEAGRTDSSSSVTPLVLSKRGSFGMAHGVASTWSAGSWVGSQAVATSWPISMSRSSSGISGIEAAGNLSNPVTGPRSSVGSSSRPAAAGRCNTALAAHRRDRRPRSSARYTHENKTLHHPRRADPCPHCSKRIRN